MKRFVLFALCFMMATVAFGQKRGAAGGATPDNSPPPSRVPVGPGPKSKAELEAVQTLLQARGNPDATIQAADNVVTKFPKSDFKSFALFTEADAWQQKNDLPKAQVFAEQALAADPRNHDADVMLANILAATTKDTDFDMSEKLTRAEKYAHDAIDILATGGKPVLFQMTEEAWARIRNDEVSRAWQAIGISALVRKKPDDAVAAYQKGLEADPNNAFLMIRTARALREQRKFDDAIAYYDKAIAVPDITPQAKTAATNEKASAQAAKSQK